MCIFYLTRKSFFRLFRIGVRWSEPTIWQNNSGNLGYMPLKYLWLTPKTSKDSQSKLDRFFFGHDSSLGGTKPKGLQSKEENI